MAPAVVISARHANMEAAVAHLMNCSFHYQMNSKYR